VSEAGFDLTELERDLRKLPGVRFARLVADRSRITEVHVVSDGSKSPKQLIRDIETLAKAAFDIELDHRVISITDFPDHEVAPTAHRIELRSLTLATRSGVANCTVGIKRADDTAEGTVSGAATANNVPNLIARATLDAASSLTGSVFAAELEAALVLPAGVHQLALVAYTFVDEDGSASLVAGTHHVRADINDAIARAALDAIERRLAV
jgi:hypothetical protein